MKLVTTTRGGKYQRYLLRGDSEGYVTLWTIPDIAIDDIRQLNVDQGQPAKQLVPTVCTSLSDAWELMNPSPVGILDQLSQSSGEPSIKLTASIYLPQQSRLVVGREDGTIIIVPATQTVMLQLLNASNSSVNGKLNG